MVIVAEELNKRSIVSEEQIKTVFMMENQEVAKGKTCNNEEKSKQINLEQAILEINKINQAEKEEREQRMKQR